jgi:hypothetical protein
MKIIVAMLAAITTPLGACAAAPAGAPPPNGPLWTADGGGVLPAAGSVPTSGRCRPVEVSLNRRRGAPEAPPARIRGEPAPCRPASIYIGYLRGTLFVEGLDAKGGRLFVATGFNPLHQDVEVPPAPGGGTPSWHAVEAPAPSVQTMIFIPVAAAPARLRWYDVDAAQQPHLLGETAGLSAPAR